MRYSFILELDQTKTKFEGEYLFEFYKQIIVDPFHAVEYNIFKQKFSIILQNEDIRNLCENNRIVKYNKKGETFLNLPEIG